MIGVVRLADLGHIPTPASSNFDACAQALGREAQVHRKLRFDNATGILYDKYGWVSRPSGYTHEPFTSLEEVMQWAFMPRINNSTCRLSRGLEA